VPAKSSIVAPDMVFLATSAPSGTTPSEVKGLISGIACSPVESIKPRLMSVADDMDQFSFSSPFDKVSL